jgi:putative hydrolases of HD superfamily
MNHRTKALDKKSAKRLLDFLHLAENLKNELRHSKTSTGRRESVAEHSWRTALMAVLLKEYLDPKLDWAKLVAMIVVHDLAETRTGDVPIFKADSRKQKKASEKRAMRELRSMLPSGTGKRVYQLWEEYELRQSLEARVVNALDKLEAQVQHNEADLNSWIEWEKVRVFGGLDSATSVSKPIIALKNAVIAEAIRKLQKAGEDINDLRKKAGTKSARASRT